MNPEEFTREVCRLMTEKQLSSREVSQRVRGEISNTSVLNMMKGHVPSADVIVVFAEALGESPDEYARIADQLLHLAGKRVRYHHAPARVTSWAAPPGVLVPAA